MAAFVATPMAHPLDAIPTGHPRAGASRPARTSRPMASTRPPTAARPRPTGRAWATTRRRGARSQRLAEEGTAATSAHPPPVFRPECPQVTRVTIAISSDAANPMVNACSATSGRPDPPARIASEWAPASKNPRPYQMNPTWSIASRRLARLSLKPQRTVTQSISTAAGRSMMQVQRSCPAVSIAPCRTGCAHHRGKQPPRPERDHEGDGARGEERDHPVADRHEHGQQEPPHADVANPCVRRRSEQRDRRDTARTRHEGCEHELRMHLVRRLADANEPREQNQDPEESRGVETRGDADRGVAGRRSHDLQRHQCQQRDRLPAGRAEPTRRAAAGRRSTSADPR